MTPSACAVDTSRFSNCRFRGHALILDPYRVVRATLEQYPRLRATRLHEMIRARGYQGSVSPRHLGGGVRAGRSADRFGVTIG